MSGAVVKFWPCAEPAHWKLKRPVWSARQPEELEEAVAVCGTVLRTLLKMTRPPLGTET